MIDLGEIAARAGRLGVLIAAGGIVWWTGTSLAKLRGAKPANVVWFEDGTLGIGMLGVPFGIAAITARLSRVSGWDSDVAWWLAAFSFASSALIALIVFRYRLIFTSDELIETRVFRSGGRRIEWRSVKSWKSGRKAGSIILGLSPSGQFEIAPAFKVGLNALYEAIDAREIPPA